MSAKDKTSVHHQIIFEKYECYAQCLTSRIQINKGIKNKDH